MTVRMSPCEPELRAQGEQNPASVRKGELREADLAVLSKEGALSSQSFILQRMTSTPFMSEGAVLSMAI